MRQPDVLLSDDKMEAARKEGEEAELEEGKQSG